MKKYYTKENLQKLIKEDIPKEIKIVIIDVLIYLDKKNINIEKQIERINKTDFIMIDSDKFEYEFTLNGKKEKVTIEKKNVKGFYKPIIVYDSEDKKIKLIKELLVIKKTSNNLDLAGRIMHELLHLLSSRMYLEENKNDSVHYSGIAKHSCSVENDELKVKFCSGEICITEAMTEVIRYYLMEKIYNVPYKIPYRLDDKNKKIYSFSSYYIITNFMNILNLGITNSTEIDYLLDVYLNNKDDVFYNKVKETYDISKDDVKNIFYELNTFMIDIFKLNISNENLKIIMLADILPLYKEILYKIYNQLQSKNNTKEELENISLFLDQLENYLYVYFSFPIFSLIREKILEFVNTIRIVYV